MQDLCGYRFCILGQCGLRLLKQDLRPEKVFYFLRFAQRLHRVRRRVGDLAYARIYAEAFHEP